MKVLSKKNIPNALFLSIAVHVLLLFILGALYRQQFDLQYKPVTELDIVKVRSRSSLRPLKRPAHLPVQPLISTEDTQQIETPKIEPTLLKPPIAATSYQDTTVELQTPEPTSPLYSEGRVSERGILQSGPVGGSSIGGIGTVGTRRSRTGKLGGATGGVLNGTGSAPPSDLRALTLPDLALTKVGKHIVANRSTDLVDIVFVVDGSGSMKNDVDAVREHLNNMTDLFDRAGIDFTIGVVAFRSGTGYGLLGLDFEVIPQTRSISQIKKVLAQLRFRGDEKGLDALIRAADEVVFRRGAEIHFIFVTDEYVSGAYSSIDVMMKMKTAKIKVDVIGRDEPFQKFIAKSTGGLWLPISSLALQ